MNRVTLLALLLAVVAQNISCSSGPKPKAERPPRDKTEILDEPVAVAPQSERKASLTEAMMLLPDTPEKPSREIDGRTDDWESGKFRRFETKAAVEKGLQYWKGRKDASFRVGVDADEGFLYFLIEVKDDKVIEKPMGKAPTDGVVLWLRDPGLDQLGEALPPSIGLEQYVDAETAILFLPKGRVEVWKDGDELDFDKVMLHEVDVRPNGYVIEVALKLEAFEEISSIPLSEIAFRVEVLDGDEEDRPGYQTLMSTLPDDGSDGARLATFPVGGLLPHVPLGASPPRINAIGRWKVEEGAWNFVSFEVVPRYWATVEDREAFANALSEADTFNEVCGVSRKDIHLVEAYQSRGGKFRMGLVLCGQRAVKKGCPADANSNVFLVELRPDGDSWRLERTISLFDKPLAQCTYDAIKGEDFYSAFSLFPLDVMSDSVWAIGWTRTRKERALDEEVFGFTMLDAKEASSPRIGGAITGLRKSTDEERTLSKSSVYLTFVDKDKNVDICQVEHLTEQGCEGVDRGCRTYDNGNAVLTNIQLWSKGLRRYERYELSKHPGCTTSFDFGKSKGYVVLQLRHRIGLLPSPESNAEGEEKLDLF